MSKLIVALVVGLSIGLLLGVPTSDAQSDCTVTASLHQIRYLNRNVGAEWEFRWTAGTAAFDIFELNLPRVPEPAQVTFDPPRERQFVIANGQGRDVNVRFIAQAQEFSDPQPSDFGGGGVVPRFPCPSEQGPFEVIVFVPETPNLTPIGQMHFVISVTLE